VGKFQLKRSKVRVKIRVRVVGDAKPTYFSSICLCVYKFTYNKNETKSPRAVVRLVVFLVDTAHMTELVFADIFASLNVRNALAL